MTTTEYAAAITTHIRTVTAQIHPLKSTARANEKIAKPFFVFRAFYFIYSQCARIFWHLISYVLCRRALAIEEKTFLS